MMSSNEGPWEIMVQYLEPAGFHVVWFSEKEDCLKYCEEHSPQVIILDPPFIGVRLIEMIQAIRQISQCPILVISLFRPNNLAQILHTGADDFLKRPFSEGALITILKNLAERYQYSQK